MSGMVVSVVTPSLNQAQFLEATIRSVLEQTHPDVEYLVVDGGSTDGSADIIRRYAGRLAHWVSEADGGQADAVNKGWRRARGEILAYLNSDDLYFPDAVQRIVAYFAQHPDVDLVYGAYQLVDADGHEMGAPVELPDVSLSWLMRHPLPQPTTFLRRRLLERVGFFDPTLHYVFDWDFWLRAAIAGGRMARLSGPPLAAFRRWDGQKTLNQFERHVEEQVRMRDRLLAEGRLSHKAAGELAFSKAWVFLWPAYQCYLRGRPADARSLLRRAARLHGRIVMHPEFLMLYARTLLGRRLSQAMRRLKHQLLWR